MAISSLDAPRTIVYSDINPDVLIESPFELVFNEESIKKSLDTIFLTAYSSRPFRRRFGTKILDLLYEPVNDRTAYSLEILLKNMATSWEDRISNIKVLVLPDITNQQYYIEFRYTIPLLGDKMVNYKFNISK